jgi:hypothetical protein
MVLKPNIKIQPYNQLVLSTTMMTYVCHNFISGIWLHHSGILGASPDGRVLVPVKHGFFIQGQGTGPAEIVEVKCPFSVRDMTILEATSRKDFFLGMPCSLVTTKVYI